MKVKLREHQLLLLAFRFNANPHDVLCYIIYWPCDAQKSTIFSIFKSYSLIVHNPDTVALHSAIFIHKII